MSYSAVTAVTSIQAKTGRYGDGQCWTLVEDTIVAAGAKSSKVLTPKIGFGVSYIWGTPTSVPALQPGDVLQFSRYDWTQTTTTKVVRPDGSEAEDTKMGGEVRGDPQHSAMVIKVISAGVVDVVEQNIPDLIGTVQTVRLCLSSTAPVTTTTKEPSGDGFVVTTTTVTNKVLNPPKCYRPQDA